MCIAILLICPSGILDFDGKHNKAYKMVLGGMRIVALSISSKVQTKYTLVYYFLILTEK